MDFETWFERLSGGSAPHPWQGEITQDPPCSRLIRIPTGMGKTLGILAAWSWHAVHRGDGAWPRRLVWCLPMRVLVEQTHEVIIRALDAVGFLWTPLRGESHSGKVGVHVLMGGAASDGDWDLYPEERAVLIGTQDMLLSRGLNRGYASGRARWPLEHGLLGHDALWVMDEVQLMDVGLATSAQLQAYHDADHARGFRPRITWWMSATLQPRWLESVDTAPRMPDWSRAPCTVSADALSRGIGAVRKSVETVALKADDHDGLAARVLAEHARHDDGEFGRITLVVCNTVERACRTFDALVERGKSGEGIELVHSRFRPHERAAWRERFLSRKACARDADRIIVATQVVEAGVDISAGCVVTELAPWPSLVQRFGRCARYGGSGHVLIVDRGRDESAALPYASSELEAALGAAEAVGEVGIERLERFERGLDPESLARLYPYEPPHLLLRRELEELFDTTPDLTGADLDIGRFIRSGDERDLQVFWLDVEREKKGKPSVRPPRKRLPRREELCAVPFLKAREWLCGKATKTRPQSRLRAGVRAWVWDFIEGDWVIAERALLSPGRVVCAASDVGGYRVERGFDPNADEVVVAVPLAALPPPVAQELRAEESQDGEDLSAATAWKTIGCHTDEVLAEAEAIARAVALPTAESRLLAIAARWHDVGKAHPAFQGAIRAPDRPDRQDIAKAPDEAWPKPPRQAYRTPDDRDVRRGLRHELASALALFAVLERHEPGHAALLGPWRDAFAALGAPVPAAPAAPCSPATSHERAVLDCTAAEFDLLAYLVASHHGKVRVALHAAPADQDYRPPESDGRGQPIRGVRRGDVLPDVQLSAAGDEAVPALTLSLDPATLGLSPTTGRSWRERTQGLLERYGPGALAWLEALMVAADRRASRLTTADPTLAKEVRR